MIRDFFLQHSNSFTILCILSLSQVLLVLYFKYRPSFDRFFLKIGGKLYKKSRYIQLVQHALVHLVFAIIVALCAYSVDESVFKTASIVYLILLMLSSSVLTLAVLSYFVHHEDNIAIDAATNSGRDCLFHLYVCMFMISCCILWYNLFW